MDKLSRTQMELSSPPSKDQQSLGSTYNKTIDNHSSNIGNRIQKATFHGDDHQPISQQFFDKLNATATANALKHQSSEENDARINLKMSERFRQINVRTVANTSTGLSGATPTRGNTMNNKRKFGGLR